MTCLPSFPLSFGTAMATMKSNMSGARSFISDSLVCHWNSTKDFGFLLGSREADGWALILAQSFPHCESTSFKKILFTAFLKDGMFITTSAIWCGLADWTATTAFLLSSDDKWSLLQESWRWYYVKFYQGRWPLLLTRTFFVHRAFIPRDHAIPVCAVVWK